MRSDPYGFIGLESPLTIVVGPVQLAPLLVDRQSWIVVGVVRHARYTLSLLPAARGTDPCPTFVAKEVSPAQVRPLSSEYVTRIVVVTPKFVQLMKIRPVSGSTSMNTLSGKSLALVEVVTSRGAVHVAPPSVDTWRQRLLDAAGVS
jgi:hypothetical protein